MKPLSFTHNALDVATSNLTGRPWLIADFRQLAVSIETQTNSASRYTVIGTNDHGLNEALGTPSQTIPNDGWSILTTIVAQGIYTFDPMPGFRWLNVFRPSASSATITFQARM